MAGPTSSRDARPPPAPGGVGGCGLRAAAKATPPMARSTKLETTTTTTTAPPTAKTMKTAAAAASSTASSTASMPVALLLWLSLACCCLLLSMCTPTAAEFCCPVELHGLEEVEPKGPESAYGSSTIYLNATADIDTIPFFFTGLMGISRPTSVMIHKAPRGSVGPPVVDLLAAASAPPVEIPAGMWWFGGFAKANKSLVMDMASLPQEYYVNVHTAEFPEGAMRGNIR